MRTIDTKHLQDLSKANQIFQSFKPVIESALKGQIVDLEMESKKIYQLFDSKAGIDGVIIRNNALQSFGLRVLAFNGFHTVTFRSSRYTGTETEYSKRLKAIESDKYLYPYLTIQVYYNKDKSLNAFSVARTKDLIEFIRDSPSLIGQNFNSKDGNGFYFIKFSDLDLFGIPNLTKYY